MPLSPKGKIREAMQNGEFKNLSGKGKPLELPDLSHVPEELRAGYTILKNAGVLPEEIQLKKEIVSLKMMIDHCYDEEGKTSLRRKLTQKILSFDTLMDKRKVNTALSYYKDKIYKKFGG